MYLNYTLLLLTVSMCTYATVPTVSPPPWGYHSRTGITLAAQVRAREATRVVGGAATQLSAIPYQAGIVVTLTSGWTSICGGALVSNNRVLTAAHCWWDGQNQAKIFTVVLGSLTIFTGGTRIETSDVTVHSQWNTDDITFDIAVVKIQTVEFNNFISSVPLPDLSLVGEDFAGTTATMSGYGYTSDAQNSFPTTTSLNHVDALVMTNAACQQSYEVSIHGSHICTNGVGGKGTCDGDSGGPLTAIWNNKRILIGLASFGLGRGCEAGYPSVYTRVTAFLSFIQANL